MAAFAAGLTEADPAARVAGPLEDPPGVVRRVIRLASKQICICHALANEEIALEDIEDGLWNLVFYKTLLGRYDEREGLITGADFRNLKN